MQERDLWQPDANGLGGAIGRRDAMRFLGSVMAVGFLTGCGNDDSVTGPTTTTPTTTSPTSPAASQCIVTPQVTEGPYFVDERLNRSDLRSDPATGALKAGVPLTLTVALQRITPSTGACTPLSGALVDMWHCDALGLYSDVGQQSTLGQKFLRGYQVSDASGLVQFTTIYPGWYQGRAVHIHFKVRTTPGASSGLEFTSQMFFDEALTDIVHAQAPYNGKGRRDTTITTDGIYRSGGTSLLFPLTATGNGYSGTFNVGVQMA